MSSFWEMTPVIWSPKAEIQLLILFTASSRFQLAVSWASTLTPGFWARTCSMPCWRLTWPDWPSGPWRMTTPPCPPISSIIICACAAPAATSSGWTLPEMDGLLSSALTGMIGMPAALAASTWGPRESAWTGTTMIASTPASVYWATWSAWVAMSRLALFHCRSMPSALA